MRKITITLIACLMALTAFAGPVSRQQAMKTATAYLQKQRAARGMSQQDQLTLAYECLPKATRGAGVNSPLFYVFNQGQQGFVVVAGDDRVKPVLGYVDEGSFAIDKVNDGVQWWLGALEQTMLSVVKIADDGQNFEVKADRSQFKPFVEPLVKVNWGQSEPHNNRCPIDVVNGNTRSLVGCTAVAMAQVLSKWKYPEHAEGRVSYTFTTGNHKTSINENLSEFVFDWDKMLPFYGGNKGTAAEKDAVAELMYACGVSVRMNYSAVASGAKLLSEHFEKHFGIDEKCNIVTRHYFTKAEWDEMMLRELSEGRPVVYSGYSLDAGHAFVCDGYNKEGLFHINWGWDGSMNGYFALAELNSAVEHAGAPTDEAGSFNIDQDMVIGIQPDDGVNETVEHSVYFNTIKNFKANTTRGNVKLATTIVCTDGNNFEGQFTLGIFDKEDNFVTAFGQSHNLNLSGYALYGELSLGGALPSSVKDGTYTLRPVSRVAGEKYKPAVGRKASPNISYLTMEVDNGRVTLSTAEFTKAKFVILDAKPLNGKAFVGAQNAIEIRMRNEGALYNGPIVLQRKGDGGKPARVFANNYIVDHGEELVIRANVNAPASGDFDELLVWIASDDKDMFYTNGFDYQQVGTVKYDLITPTPGTPALVATNVTIEDKNIYIGQNLSVDFKLANNGGFYGNNIYAFVFPGGGGNSLTSTHTKVYLDKGESTNIHFDVPVGSLAAGSYFFHIYYNSPSGLDVVNSNRFSFTIKDGAVISVTNTEGYAVYYANHAFTLPDKLEAGIVSSVDQNNIHVDYCYQGGDIVPACTPIVVKAEKRGSYSYKAAISDLTAPVQNCLSVQVDEKGYTYAGEGEFKYYAFNHDGSRANYGFYYKNDEGEPFKLTSSQKAYLAVPVAQANAGGYALNQAITGIENLTEDNRVKAGDAIYTLSGLRVKGDLKTLPKGLYIVGGKKVYVK